MSAHPKLDAWKSARDRMMGDNNARRRLHLLYDGDTFVEIDGFVADNDRPCGVICGHGTVMGSPVYAFAQTSEEHVGAFGEVQARKIAKVYDIALKTGMPVVGMYDAKTIRTGEGVGVLNAHGELLQRINNLSGVVPQVAVVLGPCNGTGALLACSADFVIMSESATLSLAPPSLAQDTPGAGGAQSALSGGIAHIVQPDEDTSINAAKRLLSLLPLNNLAAPPMSGYEEPAGVESVFTSALGPLSQQNPEAFVRAVCDNNSALELFRGFGPGVYTAVATMEGLPCGFVATYPGTLHSEDCAKIARVISVLDSYQVPILTMVNTRGFDESARVAHVREMAKIAHLYAEATAPKITLITGEAYGSAYVVFCSRGAGADRVFAWPCAAIAPLTPKAEVSAMYGSKISAPDSRHLLEERFQEQEASPVAAAQQGYIDDIIEPSQTRRALLTAMAPLSAKRVSRNPKKHGNIPM